MESISQFIQNNPYIVVVVFILTVVPGIITMQKGWSNFKKYLLFKKISFPVYVYISALILLFVAFHFTIKLSNINESQPQRPVTELTPNPPITEIPVNKPIKLKTIKGENFGYQQVRVDGKEFINCKFDQTQIVYSAEQPFNLHGNTFKGLSFVFDGAAFATIEFLTEFYKIPEVRPSIEATLDNIKKGVYPMTTPPSNAAND